MKNPGVIPVGESASIDYRFDLCRAADSLPIEGGVEAAYRRQLEAAPDREALRAELEERLASLRSPLLVQWARRAWNLLPSALGPKARPLRPCSPPGTVLATARSQKRPN